MVGNGDAMIVQRHMEFSGGIAYGIDRLLEPPDLGSRCDEFVFVELQVSASDKAEENLHCLLSSCQGRGMLGGLTALPWQSTVQLREAEIHIELLWGFFLPSTEIYGELRTLWLRAALPSWLSSSGKAPIFATKVACCRADDNTHVPLMFQPQNEGTPSCSKSLGFWSHGFVEQELG